MRKTQRHTIVRLLIGSLNIFDCIRKVGNGIKTPRKYTAILRFLIISIYCKYNEITIWET